MRAALISLSDALHAATRLVALVMLAVLVGAVSLQVIARYGFSAPPVWTEEAARYAMIWVGLMGAAMSFKARFDPALFTPKTGRRGRIALRAVQTLFVLIFTAPILYYSVIGTNGTFARSFLGRAIRSTSGAMDLPMIWVAAAVPVAFTVILVHLAARWAGDARDLKSELLT
ncbi:TRAP transporter small permease [Ruegeria marina]|uniref:TRAP transporter small permease protein n=1 Tax=Ruegeria marina TaxID=639004 RepID=A0A1G7EUK2_9RHOB|nr:TRAP transporter small permease subunit [Ruegeria marina]SDE67267.1 TRAP-type C4-dicarboxylate transport system, small permease component [Ruegeria marina]